MATSTCSADLIDGLGAVAVPVAAYGPGWTEAPFACCGDCRLVFHDTDLAYDRGADDWLCPLCVLPEPVTNSQSRRNLCRVYGCDGSAYHVGGACPDCNRAFARLGREF